jgi:hypothetical protein
VKSAENQPEGACRNNIAPMTWPLVFVPAARRGDMHGVRSSLAVGGMNILNNLNVSNAALMFMGLERWEQRKTPGLHPNSVAVSTTSPG